MTLRIYGNRRLRTLEGLATRPTPARVRAALFNIWQGRITDCRWLDLCAGIGSLGAEALLRGASVVVGIEHSPAAVRILQENWQRCADPDQQIEILRTDILQGLRRLQQQQRCFDFIYFDPPYASDLYLPVLMQLAPLLAPDGECVAEHLPSRPLPDQIGDLRRFDQRQYGQTALSFYCHAANP